METLLGVVGNIWTEITTLIGVITASAILLVPLGFKFANSTIGSGQRLLGIGGRRRR